MVCVRRALTEEPWPSGQLTARARSVVGWAYRWLVPERRGRDRLVQLEPCRPRSAHKRRTTDMEFPTTVHQLAHTRRCAQTSCVGCGGLRTAWYWLAVRVLWRHPHFKLNRALVTITDHGTIPTRSGSGSTDSMPFRGLVHSTSTGSYPTLRTNELCRLRVLKNSVVLASSERVLWRHPYFQVEAGRLSRLLIMKMLTTRNGSGSTDSMLFRGLAHT